MPPRLNENTAKQIVQIVKRLGRRASFGNILLEARTESVLSWDRTLRRYLDLLILGGVLSLKEKDVGSVYPQQLYTVQATAPHAYAGLSALRHHGLNMDVSDRNLDLTETDFSGLMRSRVEIVGKDRKLLIVGLEDALIHEFLRDVQHGSGTAELVAAMLVYRPADIPYLLHRADVIGIGQTIRLMINRLIEIFTIQKPSPGMDGRIFLFARERFLKTLRMYSSKGVLRLLDERGKGKLGIELVNELQPEQIVAVVGKQLGVAG